MKLFQILEKFDLYFIIIIFIIISALFLISIVLIIEKIYSFRKIYINEKKIYKDLNNALNNKNMIFVFSLCKKLFSPLTNLINAGLNQRNYSEFYIKESITQAVVLELPNFEKNLIIITVLTTILPIISLIMVFIDNIELFIILESTNNNNLDFFSLFNIKTLFIFFYGIFSAIIISLLYYYITKKKNDLILIIEKWANELVFSLIQKNKR